MEKQSERMIRNFAQKLFGQNFDQIEHNPLKNYLKFHKVIKPQLNPFKKANLFIIYILT
jgi:hypothetical protein